MGNTNPHKINIGYSRQFIRALAFLDRVNIGAITKAIHTKEIIIKIKLIENRKPCLTYKELLKKILVDIKLRPIPLNPRVVLARTFPKTIFVNLEGLDIRFSKVPI